MAAVVIANVYVVPLFHAGVTPAWNYTCMESLL